MAPRRRKFSIQPAAQTAAVALVPQPHGGALLPGGMLGTAGGLGRPPDEFKRRMSACVSREQTLKALEEILADRDHPHFMRALEFAAARGYGAVKQEVSLEGGATILIAPIPRGDE